jgi:hypothetical protein
LVRVKSKPCLTASSSCTEIPTRLSRLFATLTIVYQYYNIICDDHTGRFFNC